MFIKNSTLIRLLNIIEDNTKVTKQLIKTISQQSQEWPAYTDSVVTDNGDHESIIKIGQKVMVSSSDGKKHKAVALSSTGEHDSVNVIILDESTADGERFAIGKISVDCIQFGWEENK